jgi:AAA domain-containing protein
VSEAFQGPEPGSSDDIEWPGEAPGEPRPAHEYTPYWEYQREPEPHLPPVAPVGWDAPNGANGTGPKVFIDAYEFVETEVEAPRPLLGSEETSVIPAGGLCILAGRPGVGKTTFVLDLACHLAAGVAFPGADENGHQVPTPWPVERPLRVAVIENEGPQEMFRSKLADKLGRFPYDIRERGGYLAIQAWRWGAFNFGDKDAHGKAHHELQEDGIDLVIGDPLTMLGPRGVGSPEDTRLFVQMLYPLGLGQDRAFLFLHHFRERAERTEDELARISGAWGGHLDTLMTLSAGAQADKARLAYPKLRWAKGKPPNPVILGRVYATSSYEALAEEGDAHHLEPMIHEWLGKQRAAGTGRKGWHVVRAIAQGIESRDGHARKALEGAPHLFAVLTGPAAKALGAKHNAKLWGLKEWPEAEGEAAAPEATEQPELEVPDEPESEFPF